MGHPCLPRDAPACHETARLPETLRHQPTRAMPAGRRSHLPWMLLSARGRSCLPRDNPACHGTRPACDGTLPPAARGYRNVAAGLALP